MSRLISTLLIAAALGSFEVPVALAGHGTTAADGWQVLESHGGVRYRSVSERQWWPARTGIEIPAGSTIATGTSGFLIIARAGESITLRTNSRLELQGGPDGETVQQTAGDLRYRITRAPDRRFGVETPYLSLMVKGTVFDVKVSDHGAEVEVRQGQVRVGTPRGQVAELTPGQSARIAESADAGLEFRAGPDSPFAAAPPAGNSIAAAYPRGDGNGTADRRHTADAGRSDIANQRGAALGITQGRVRLDTPRGQAAGRIPGQSAPNVGGGGARLAFRTPPTGPVEASPTPSRSTAEAATRGEATIGTDRRRRDPDGQAAGSDQAFPGGLDAAGASGARLEITADEARVDRPGPQVVEMGPGQGPPVAGSARLDPESGSGHESAVALPPPPDRSIAAAEARGDGKRSMDSSPSEAPDQAADQVSSGGTGDRTAVALLVLLGAVVWWRRQRQRTASSTDRGRWPWQRPRVGTSSGAPSIAPSPPSMTDGTRRSTTYARP